MLNPQQLDPSDLATISKLAKAFSQLAGEDIDPQGQAAEDADTNTDGDQDQPDMIYWQGVIAVEGVLTGDGRLIEPGALEWAASPDSPLPLRSVAQDNGAHDGAELVGSIFHIWREDQGDGTVNILAAGDFDPTTDAGRAAAEQVASGRKVGVSVDLDSLSFEVRVAEELISESTDSEELDQEGEKAEVKLPTDGEGRVIISKIAADAELFVATSARIRAATIVDIPAFAEAKIAITDELPSPLEDTVEEPGDDLPQVDRTEGLDDLTASAAPVTPPAAWFADPQLTEPTPLTITEDGRIFGHLATWNVCHTANPAGDGVCVTAPTSETGYARFHTGTVLTDEGDLLPTGRITMGTGHASPRASASAAAAHYDNTGTCVADVRAGEDDYGIWFAGALRPTVTDEQVRALRGSPLSGDWRTVNGNLELHAALAVNTPGFPIPRPAGLVASGHLTSLVASGVLTPSKEDQDAVRAFALKRMRERADDAMRQAVRARVAAFARRTRSR